MNNQGNTTVPQIRPSESPQAAHLSADLNQPRQSENITVPIPAATERTSSSSQEASGKSQNAPSSAPLPDSKRGLNLLERNWERQLQSAVETGETKNLAPLLAPNVKRPARFEKCMGIALNKAIAKKPSSLPIVKLLLDNGAKAFNGATPLHLAAFNNNPGVAKFLLEEEDIHPDTPDDNGETAFFWAAKYGHADIAEMLMNHDANPCLGKTDLTTPLHIAAFEGHVEVVQLLLDNKEKLGLDIDAPDGKGETALSQAANRSRLEVAVLLLEAGASLPTEEKPLLALIEIQSSQEDFEGALRSVDKLIALHPTSEYVLLKADLLVEANDAGGAEALLLQHRPLDLAILDEWLGMLTAQNRHGEVVEKLLEMMSEIPDSPILFQVLGETYKELGHYEGALKAYSCAHPLAPNDETIIIKLGETHEVMGNVTTAKELFEKALGLNPLNAGALMRFGERHRYVSGDEAFNRLTNAAMQIHQYPKAEQINLHYALGKAYDDIGDLKTAFDHYRIGGKLGNEEAIGHTDYIKFYKPRLNALKTQLRAETIARGKSEGHPSDKPVFIVSMPRSGSTLLEQMLASHPQIFGAGELPFLPKSLANLKVDGVVPMPDRTIENFRQSLYERGAEYLKKIESMASGSPERIVDKWPLNALHAGLIPLVLPNAHIIHCRRHPVEICLSCYRIGFADENLGFTNDLAELGRAYRNYHETMQFWKSVLPEGKILEVWYEDVVDDAQEQIRRALDHVGMPWDENCLRFDKNKRQVATASNLQVRQPIYRDATDNRWHKYKPYLGPLLEALGPLVEEYEKELVEGREERFRKLQPSLNSVIE